MSNPILTDTIDESYPAEVEIETPKSEQEMPPPEAQQRSTLIVDLPKEDVDRLEKTVRVTKAAQEIHLKNHAFVLLCFCLGSFVLFYFADTIFINIGWETSTVLASAIDMAKTIVTFLIGYLFATEKSKN